MTFRAFLVLLSAGILFFGFDRSPLRGESATLTLVQAFVSEDVRDGTPKNPGMVFPVAVGKVACFTAFDPVPRRTAVFHNWYRRDELNTRIRLVLQPPRWATFSSIQLREIDKGPWRIEIADQEGQVLHTLRFSITD